MHGSSRSSFRAWLRQPRRPSVKPAMALKREKPQKALNLAKPATALKQENPQKVPSLAKPATAARKQEKPQRALSLAKPPRALSRLATSTCLCGAENPVVRNCSSQLVRALAIRAI